MLIKTSPYMFMLELHKSFDKTKNPVLLIKKSCIYAKKTHKNSYPTTYFDNFNVAYASSSKHLF